MGVPPVGCTSRRQGTLPPLSGPATTSPARARTRQQPGPAQQEGGRRQDEQGQAEEQTRAEQQECGRPPQVGPHQQDPQGDDDGQVHEAEQRQHAGEETPRGGPGRRRGGCRRWRSTHGESLSGRRIHATERAGPSTPSRQAALLDHTPEAALGNRPGRSIGQAAAASLAEVMDTCTEKTIQPVARQSATVYKVYCSPVPLTHVRGTPMLAKLNTFALVGIDAVPVVAEVDVSVGLPKTVVLGNN